MSLLNSLLLDATRINFWVSLRPGRVKGCGTQADPYNGSTLFDPARAVSGIARNVSQPTEATVFVVGHGYVEGDEIEISGVTGSNAGFYNGRFFIYGVTTDSFKYQMSSPGPTADALNAGIQGAKVVEYLFDEVMQSIPEHARVHLGPGIFETRGYADGVASGWQPKKGLQLVGSGVDVSTIRLVGAQAPASGTRHYWAIGHALQTGGSVMDNVVVSGMTIDCNLRQNPQAGAFAAGAVRLMGSHTRVRRVKVINWGAKSSGPPCWVVAMITADPSWWSGGPIADTGIEECVAIDPDPSTSTPVTVLHVGPKGPPGAEQEGVGIGGVIRNCYVDCAKFASPMEPDVRALSIGWCQAGVLEGNEVHRVRVGGPYLEGSSARDIVVRFNTYNQVRRGPYLKLGQKSGSPIAISSITFTGIPGDFEATVSTGTTNHKLNLGDRVELNCAESSLNGVFEVTAVTSPTGFKYRTPGPTNTFSDGDMEKVFGVGRILVEGNTIALAKGSEGETAITIEDNPSLPLHAPDYVYGVVIVRDNKIGYVDGEFDPSYAGTAIEVFGARNLNVQDNVIRVAPLNSIRDERGGSSTYFNNKTPDGVLVRGLREDTAQKYDELETQAEDALVLSLLFRR